MNSEKVIKKIATRDGVTVGYVRAEIQNAIDIGTANPDPHIQAFWKAVPHKGERLTPEDVICFITEKLSKKLMNNIVQL